MYTDFIDSLLNSRGIVSVEEKEKFLNPSYDGHLYDPYLMPDMERAVVRLFEAIEGKEKIVIYSDYDCDGIPGAVILHDLLKKVGYENFSVYIPDRHDEGYGLNHDAIETFITEKTDLLITIDLGSTDREDIAYAQANGIDVIVTDHHLPPLELPTPFAFVNPKVPGSKYPDPMLCGSGVIFKFVQGFLFKYREYFKIPVGYEKWLLDMTGLATLSDMVPLVDENRVLATYGLMVLRKSPRPGLRMLLAKAGVNQNNLSEDDVTFMVTPRINAASRMDSPMLAFRLLSTTDEKEASELVIRLEAINTERKTLVATIMKKVKKKLDERDTKDIIVIGDPSWRIGVLGLIAGKVCDMYGKPAFVWGREGSTGSTVIKGSCRSPAGVHVVDIMRGVENSFINVGGHAQAGGFSILEENIHTLEEKLLSSYEKVSSMSHVDSEKMENMFELRLDDIREEHYKAIQTLAPFGFGNPKPLFRFTNAVVGDVKLFGKEKNHLELTLVHDKGERKAICFFIEDTVRDALPKKGEKIVINGTLEISYFAGRVTKRIRIVKIEI